MASEYIRVERESPRFQLIKRYIDMLSPEGIYHFVADVTSKHPIEYKATRQQLEEVFEKAMATASYKKGGLYHQNEWRLADRFRV